MRRSLDRRRFIQATAAGTLGALLPSHTVAATTWQTEFRQALDRKPWLLGYATAGQSEFQGTAKITGKWPTELSGTLYRNGPAQHEIGTYRYRHWFDGDGMVQAFSINDQGVSHQAKFIATHKYLAERDAGRALYPGFGSIPPNPAGVTSPDTLNSGNISMLHHHGKLMALWEAGSPWEIDPQDLSTQGTYAFSNHTRGVPFSAHPRVEPDGTLWNFGYLSAAHLLVLWHINAQGSVVKMGKLNIDPITMVHDFIVTHRHLVVLLPPFNYDPEYDADAADNFLDAHNWQQDQATRVLVIDKNDFSQHFTLELPAQWVFHFGNGWEDEAGVIRFDGARADNPQVMISAFREVMRGRVVDAPVSMHHQYRLDTKARRITEVPLFGPGFDTEFPSIDPRISTRRNDKLLMLSRDQHQTAPHTNLNAVTAFDFRSGKRQTFTYPDTQIPEEHLYVPKPGSKPERQGWVVGTTLDWKSANTKLHVFAADNLASGPIASATLPYALPLGLHGKFVHG